MRYRTIVADPPWEYKGGVSFGGSRDKLHAFQLPYQAMTLDEIAALPIPELAEDDAWLFLWGTNRYLPAVFDLAAGWGFEYRQMLVWNKPGASPFGGTFASNGAEYLGGFSRGAPALNRRWHQPSVLTHNRMGAGGHSRKPEVFLDLIETCCPGPYLELFARRNRLGWDTWGNESLEHVKLGKD